MTAGRSLRILHTEASLGWGGQEIRILTEARQFMDHGHEVRLICDSDSDIFAAAPRYGLKTAAVPLKRKSLAALRAVRRAFTDWAPHIVNCHSSIDHWVSAVARLGFPSVPAIVRTRHIAAPVSRNAPTRWLYNKGCEAVMTTSEAMVRELTSDGFLAPDHVTAVPTGIDAEAFRPGDRGAARTRIGLPEAPFVFGTVATLRSWKGHGFLFDAFARVADDGALLLIVGDGPQEGNLKKHAGSLGIAASVRMVGRQEDVVPYLRAMDAFVLPSYANEGVPQALLQAMACGLPVIASRVGGIPELTEGLDAVRRIPPRDAEALAEEMVRMMEDRPGPAALAALRGRVVDRYTLRSMYDRVLEIFRKAIDSRLPTGTF